MTVGRNSILTQLLQLPRTIEEMKGKPGGLASINEEGDIEQAVTRFPKDVPNGVAGLDNTGKLSMSILRTNGPGDLPTLGANATLNAATLPSSLVSVGQNGTLALEVLPEGVRTLGADPTRVREEALPDNVLRLVGGYVSTNALPTAVPRVQSDGFVAASTLPTDIVQTDGTGKVPVAQMPPQQVPFDSFTSYVTNGYYTYLQLRPMLNYFNLTQGAHFLDAHGRRVSNTIGRGFLHSRVGGESVFAVDAAQSTNNLSTQGVANYGGISIPLGASSFIDAFAVSPATPMVFEWEVAPTAVTNATQPIHFKMGLASHAPINGAGYQLHTGVDPYSQGSFSCFRFYNPAAGGTTNKFLDISHTNNTSDLGVQASVYIETGVPIVLNQYLKLKMVLNSASEIEYYVNDAFQHSQKNFFYSSTVANQKNLHFFMYTNRTINLKNVSIKVPANDTTRHLLT